MFRDVAGPGRGHSPAFYQLLGKRYEMLVDSGEPHPVKAIAAECRVKISTASKWLKKARRRGYPPPSRS
jgi:DNA-binding MarR family transcriptional regulator